MHTKSPTLLPAIFYTYLLGLNQNVILDLHFQCSHIKGNECRGPVDIRPLF